MNFTRAMGSNAIANTCIDHATTNCHIFSKVFMKVKNNDAINSDHGALFLFLYSNIRTKDSFGKIISSEKINYELIKENKIFADAKMNDFDNLVKFSNEILKQHTEVITFKQRFKNNFMNTKIKKLMSIRDNFRKKHKKFPDNEKFKIDYITFRN